MMTPSNGNIYRATGHLCREFAGHWWIPLTIGQWRRALVFSLICAWINGLVNNREAGDLRRHRAQYDVTVIIIPFSLKQYHGCWFFLSLRWRHNGHNGVSNHQPHHCLLNRLFGCRSQKTSKLRVTGLCAVNSPGTGEFPAQMTSNAENVSIWWRHHVIHSCILNTMLRQWYRSQPSQSTIQHSERITLYYVARDTHDSGPSLNGFSIINNYLCFVSELIRGRRSTCWVKYVPDVLWLFAMLLFLKNKLFLFPNFWFPDFLHCHNINNI